MDHRIRRPTPPPTEQQPRNGVTSKQKCCHGSGRGLTPRITALASFQQQATTLLCPALPCPHASPSGDSQKQQASVSYRVPWGSGVVNGVRSQPYPAPPPYLATHGMMHRDMKATALFPEDFQQASGSSGADPLYGAPRSFSRPS